MFRQAITRKALLENNPSKQNLLNPFAKNKIGRMFALYLISLNNIPINHEQSPTSLLPYIH